MATSTWIWGVPSFPFVTGAMLPALPLLLTIDPWVFLQWPDTQFTIGYHFDFVSGLEAVKTQPPLRQRNHHAVATYPRNRALFLLGH
jgi:hypothetical protein